MIPLYYLLLLSAAIFAIGWVGLMIRRNILILLMSIELMLNAVNLTFVSFSRYSQSMDGQVIAFFVMTLAACEAAVGLAILITLFRYHKSVNSTDFNGMRG